MPDVTLVEEKLSFAFKDVDFAEKYDDWKHYRNQYNSVCGGSKAVDFLVMKNDEIWLIEVKDYRQYKRSKAIDLADEVALKVRDTMAGLVSAKFVAKDDGEIATSRKALSGKKLRVALHLEQPKKAGRSFSSPINPAVIQMKLKQILRFADPHVKLTDRSSFPEYLGKVGSI